LLPPPPLLLLLLLLLEYVTSRKPCSQDFAIMAQACASAPYEFPAFFVRFSS